MSLLTTHAIAPAVPDLRPGQLLRRRSLALPLALGGLAAWPLGCLLVYLGVGRELDGIIWSGAIGLVLSALASLSGIVELLTERHTRGRLCAGLALILSAGPWVATAWFLGALGMRFF